MNKIKEILFNNINLINWVLCLAFILLLACALIEREFDFYSQPSVNSEEPSSLYSDSTYINKIDTLNLTLQEK